MTFKDFSKANLERCEKHFHKLNDWTPAEWACALGGECGELLNFIKKLTRLTKNSKYTPDNDYEKLLGECKKEIGDIAAYLDLIAARLGFKLEDCIKEKFNEVSDRVKSNIKL